MKIIKRNGSEEKFDITKIENAITKAMVEVGERVDKHIIKAISSDVQSLCKSISGKPTVEEIQDFVELKLADKFPTVAIAYAKFRTKKEIKRNEGWKLSEFGQRIWESKYRYNNESFEEFLDRVSGKNKKIKKLIRDKKFLFGGRILASRGTDRKVSYSNCYVMPEIKDNIEDIWKTSMEIARTYSYGGGCGITINNLRPKGMKVNNCAEETTGAVSFMELYDATTSIIGQKGRRGALMINIGVEHPDIYDFIKVKQNSDKITKANISVRCYNDFLKAVENNDMWTLHYKCEDTGEETKREVHARNLFHMLCKSNFDWGEPGILYWDNINNWCLTSNDERIKFAGVNPCAEEPLPEYGACLLGSINLSEYVYKPFTDDAVFDFDSFVPDIANIVKAMNDVLDEGIPKHPLLKQRKMARDWRQIGIGIMGLADMCLKLGIQYGSKQCKFICEIISDNLLNTSIQASSLLATIDGSYPMYDYERIKESPFYKHLWDETKEVIKDCGLRNSQLLTIAPTGSISNMFGISGGIEPIYKTSYIRKAESLGDEDEFYSIQVPVVKQFLDVTPSFKEEDVVTAMNVSWEDRIDLQAIWQKNIDASISSTINLHEEATVEDIEKIYMYAYQRKLKGITVFRDNCKRLGVMANSFDMDKKESKELCPECGSEMIHTGGCLECTMCGFSPCSI